MKIYFTSFEISCLVNLRGLVAIDIILCQDLICYPIVLSLYKLLVRSSDLVIMVPVWIEEKELEVKEICFPPSHRSSHPFLDGNSTPLFSFFYFSNNNSQSKPIWAIILFSLIGKYKLLFSNFQHVKLPHRSSIVKISSSPMFYKKKSIKQYWRKKVMTL